MLSVSQQMFVSVPVFPRPTPWIVAVAVIVVVLGILIIGSVFFTWRLYQDRSRQRKGEFSSTGTSLNPGLPGDVLPGEAGAAASGVMVSGRCLTLEFCKAEGTARLPGALIPSMRENGVWVQKGSEPVLTGARDLMFPHYLRQGTVLTANGISSLMMKVWPRACRHFLCLSQKRGHNPYFSLLVVILQSGSHDSTATHTMSPPSCP